MDITEDVVKSVVRKIPGRSGSGGTDSEALHGWLLKFWEDRKILRISVDIFVDWIANKITHWAVYREFISDCLIELEKWPGVCPVVIRETWRRLFSKCVLRGMGPKATNACKYEQLCAGLKAGINGPLHGVKDIWDANYSTKDWGFLLVDVNNDFNEINRIGMLWTVHLWPSRYRFFKFLSSLVNTLIAEWEWYGQFSA